MKEDEPCDAANTDSDGALMKVINGVCFCLISAPMLCEH